MTEALWEAHSKEDPTSLTFFHHKKQIYIFTPAGKPVFCRYGNVLLQSSTTATLTALISYTSSDPIQSIHAPDNIILFDTTTPLSYCIISKTGEYEKVLLRQLSILIHVLHSFISLPTIKMTLQNASNFDLRRIVAGHYSLLKNAIHLANEMVGICVGCTEIFPLQSKHREELLIKIDFAINTCEKTMEKDGVLFVLILNRNKTVFARGRKGVKMSTRDILAIIAHVNTIKVVGKKVLLPMCLSDFNENAFVQSYFNFYTEDITIVAISTQAESFQSLNVLCCDIENMMKDIEISTPDIQCQLITQNKVLNIVVTQNHQIYTTGIFTKEQKRDVANALSRQYTEEMINYKDYYILHKRVEEAEYVAVVNPFITKTDLCKLDEDIFVWVKQVSPTLWLANPPLW
ncbi:hypothetical protein EIN_281570 [Entamoeba invadens IP1]|uniref:FUZ/MON1/HPS1 first Longin domain-containing protein n=1 Tax=Entamoeba invadens IP1 TaxID=370355 RepID=A0A0A1TZZ3_ENTIV|nr:hypothetical protein EIN_281570 [Entamoeba invadens IP1]ELP85786.1 hypothetical protein EIN_281570 [Entamoeba invadens IP1]|eukprot:XP_004185132.1 hypothetical protein EIN_281570 [Entamoeba invadens IP1]